MLLQCADRSPDASIVTLVLRTGGRVSGSSGGNTLTAASAIQEAMGHGHNHYSTRH